MKCAKLHYVINEKLPFVKSHHLHARMHCSYEFVEKQEAQLLLGGPTHGAKSIYLEVKVMELS